MSNNLFYPNLVPGQDDYPTCTNAMTKLFDLAPTDSDISAFINLLADGTYHTVIAITAICGPFRSEAKTRSMVSSVKLAQQNMLSNLVEWKKIRFGIAP